MIASILMVARNNAIITADLGNRVLSAQFLAMRNLHIPGRFYLTLAILANTLLGGLFLVVASLVLASWASLHTWQFLFPEQPVELWQENFFFSYHQDPEGFFRNMGWGFLKVLASTTGSAWLAISIGLARKESVIAVNYAIARSIVWGVTFTLAIHACITVAMY
jgi:ABC-type transporter Mla maintaining outer membrane lipid asymmetry permease subunit MlaE